MIRAAALRQAAAMATTGHSFHPIRLGSWYSSRAAAIPTRSGLGARCCPWEDTTNYNSNSNTSASSFGGGRRLGGGSGTTATRHFRRERKTFLKKKLTKAAAMDDDDDSHTESDTTTTTASSSSSSSSTTNNNDNNTTTKSVVASTWTSFGENAPRLPHLLAIPLVSRPLFPGLVTSLTLTDPATIDALDHHWYNRTNYNSSSSSSSSTTTTTPTAAYISCFLRSQHSSGVSEGGVLLSTPEVIQDPSDLYKTGTFAQIKSFTRGVTANPKPVDLNSSTSRNNNSNRHRHRSMDGSSDDEDEENATSSSSSSKNNNSAATLILLAHRRVDLVSVDDIGPPIDVTVSHWPRVEYITNDSIRALSNEIISIIREIAQMNVLFRENLQLYPMRFDANDPFRLADFAASITASGTPEDLQAVLEERDPEQRLHKALLLLNREREVSKLQMEISAKVEKKLTEAQRKYFLTEQLKSIKKELGMERDDKDALLQKFRQQLSEYPDVPAEIMETIESELEKFASLEKNSAEFNVTRGYLDWLVGVPWGVVTDENFDIGQARITLDRDHYGLDDVKSTILQFIAIGKLKGSVQGRILCLVGPPGTGKTSIAQSVADSLGRKFYRFSVGGLSDVSEIKGHRRTYIGSMPGKLIQCLKTTGTTNPVVLIDEIDKLGSGFRGDPASALLEVLDPGQNSTFRDHYLDVPVDISKVLFICTANDLERIPAPLLDRMEVIRLSGYDFPEKVVIAEQFLVPKSMKKSGLMQDRKIEEATPTDSLDDGTQSEQPSPQMSKAQTPLDNYVHTEGVPKELSIAPEAVKCLVRWYARESGVRSLAKYIDKITGKLALQVVAENEGTKLSDKSTRKADSWVVAENNLSDYVGKPVFTKDRLYEDAPLPNGIIMGLAYTSMGGSALYIETQAIQRGLDSEGKKRGGGSLKLTGQLGSVMEESAQIAYTVARARLAGLDPKSSFFDEQDLHMHVPEGATPKDGPSAGIAMTTSMLSLALGKPCNIDLAMTGEISLTGKVLPVGGIKEKIMAARRAGITEIVLPNANRRDFDEIADYLKDGLDVFWAEDYSHVYDAAFSDIASS